MHGYDCTLGVTVLVPGGAAAAGRSAPLPPEYRSCSFECPYNPVYVVLGLHLTQRHVIRRFSCSSHLQIAQIIIPRMRGTIMNTRVVRELTKCRYSIMENSNREIKLEDEEHELKLSKERRRELQGYGKPEDKKCV